MEEKFAYKIVDDLAVIGYKNRLSFFCGNEPLLDPRLEDFFAYASEKLPGATLTLVSNGDLATSKVLQRLFNAGMKKIIFSLHSAKRKEELYEYQREFGEVKIVVMDYVNIDMSKRLHNHGGLIESDRVSQQRYPSAGCTLPFKQLVVYPDNTIGLCSADMKENIKVKVQAHESILDVFYESKELNDYRKMLALNKRDTFPCFECSYSGEDYF